MAEPSPIRWEDPRFAPEIEKVRKSCNVTHTDDDAMIGMCASLCQRQDSCEHQASSQLPFAGSSTGATGTTPR